MPELTSTLTRARAALSHHADRSFTEPYTQQPRAGHNFLEARQAQQLEGRPRIPPPVTFTPFNIIKARRGLGRIPPKTEQKTHGYRANPQNKGANPLEIPSESPCESPEKGANPLGVPSESPLRIPLRIPPSHLPWGCSCGDGEVACHAVLSALHTYALPFFQGNTTATLTSAIGPRVSRSLTCGAGQASPGTSRAHRTPG